MMPQGSGSSIQELDAKGKQWNGNVNQWNRILIQWNKIVNQWIANRKPMD
jgi:hypothetical protein